MKSEFKTVGFRCYDLGAYDRIAKAADNSGLAKAKYIERVVINAVDGNVPDIARIEKLTIEMMSEVQTIKNKYPQVNVSGLERIGGELLCQI